jgi:hypothetical protein
VLGRRPPRTLGVWHANNRYRGAWISRRTRFSLWMRMPHVALSTDARSTCVRETGSAEATQDFCTKRHETAEAILTNRTKAPEIQIIVIVFCCGTRLKRSTLTTSRTPVGVSWPSRSVRESSRYREIAGSGFSSDYHSDCGAELPCLAFQ